MTGRRRGRTGRGWDPAPPRARRTAPGRRPGPAATGPEAPPDPVEPPPDPARDPAELAREICLRQLAVRPRTRAELATALRRRGIADRVAAEVLDRYDQVGMIDDAAFARAWVASRHHSRGLARRVLGSELRQRGVAPDAVGEALGQLDADTEARTARALVDRRLRTATGAPEAIARRLVGMLARKGYQAALAYRVVKEALAQDERTAALADRLDPDALADTVDTAVPDDR
jgi:regulatory protein